MTSTPIVTTEPTSCDGCDSDMPTGCVGIERVEHVIVERSVPVSRAMPGITLVGAITTRTPETRSECVCLDCAMPEEKMLVGGVMLVSSEFASYTDATPDDILRSFPIACPRTAEDRRLPPGPPPPKRLGR